MRRSLIAIMGLLIAVAALAGLPGASNGAAVGTLVINAPGVYDGGGMTRDVACDAEHNVEINADNVTLRNYILRNANGSAVEIGSVSNTRIDNVQILDFNCSNASDKTRAGIAARKATSLTIVNSLIQTGRHYGNGIWVKNNDPATGGGHYIADNTIAGGWDCIGGEPENYYYGTFYKDTIIERNTIIDCWDDGIQVEGGTANVYVRDNYIQRSAIGIAFAPSVTGPLHIERNTIVDGRPGYYGATYAVKTGDGGSGDVFFTENYISTPGNGLAQGGGSPLDIRLVTRDNVIDVTLYVMEFKDEPAPGSSLDRDCFWTTDPSRFVKWVGTRYGSLADFQAATGQEPNGTVSETCSASPPPPPPDTDNDLLGDACDPWADVHTGHWAASYIDALYDAGITVGCATGPLRYCPNDLVTRAQMAVFILRALGEDQNLPAYQGYFSDVPDGLWYTGFVERLFQLGISAGFPDGTYRPNNTVSRAEMAVFLLRATGEEGNLPAYQGYFSDVPEGLWYTGFVERLFQLNITTGYPDGTYRPDNKVSRAEMAAFIARAWSLPTPP